MRRVEVCFLLFKRRVSSFQASVAALRTMNGPIRIDVFKAACHDFSQLVPHPGQWYKYGSTTRYFSGLSRFLIPSRSDAGTFLRTGTTVIPSFHKKTSTVAVHQPRRRLSIEDFEDGKSMIEVDTIFLLDSEVETTGEEKSLKPAPLELVLSRRKLATNLELLDKKKEFDAEERDPEAARFLKDMYDVFAYEPTWQSVTGTVYSRSYHSIGFHLLLLLHLTEQGWQNLNNEAATMCRPQDIKFERCSPDRSALAGRFAGVLNALLSLCNGHGAGLIQHAKDKGKGFTGHDKKTIYLSVHPSLRPNVKEMFSGDFQGNSVHIIAPEYGTVYRGGTFSTVVVVVLK
ncbi:unnamed protein product [Amoebophrya sp. A25]|nr:unnamed protein product [Amoebophrya sp. A25]|eukprot:GSA25T00005145001.1